MAQAESGSATDLTAPKFDFLSSPRKRNSGRNRAMSESAETFDMKEAAN